MKLKTKIILISSIIIIALGLELWILTVFKNEIIPVNTLMWPFTEQVQPKQSI